MHTRNILYVFLAVIITFQPEFSSATATTETTAKEICEISLEEAGLIAFPESLDIPQARHQELVKDIRAQFKEKGFAAVDVGDLFTEEAGRAWWNSLSDPDVTAVEHQGNWLITSPSGGELGRTKKLGESDPRHKYGLTRVGNFFRYLLMMSFQRRFELGPNAVQARPFRADGPRLEVPNWHVDGGGLVVVLTVYGDKGTDVLGVTRGVRGDAQKKCREMNLNGATYADFRKLCGGVARTRAKRGEAVIMFGNAAKAYWQRPLVHRSPPNRGDSVVLVIRFH